MEYLDLRDVRDEALLQRLYDGLYLASFPLPEEREDTADWRRLLWEDDHDGEQVVLHAIVAGTGLRTRREHIAGFIFVELYPESCCGLISYLGVDPDVRREGLARKLISRAVRTLEREAAATGRPLRAIFAEIHVPEANHATDDSMDPAERVSFFAKLGCRVVPIDYVQPDLGHGHGPARRLELIALPIDGDPRELQADCVRAFLAELYGAQAGRADSELAAMLDALQDESVRLPPLNEVPEEPAFAIKKYGVAFHFVTRDPPGYEALADVGKASEQFASFEHDLLAYAYRGSPPFASRGVHVPAPYRRLDIEFSPELRFVSEGRTSTLVAGLQPPREVQVRASVTRFRSGVTVRHLTLTPRSGSTASALTEYDLIKLAKVWEGGEEIKGLYADGQCIRLRGTDTRSMSLMELAKSVFGAATIGDQPPWAGTIQLITTDSEYFNEWPKAWTALRELKAETGIDVSMPPTDEGVRRVVEGVAGIFQGLIDFEQIDVQELREVIAGTEIGDDGIQGIHKGTLLFVGDSDRVLDVGLRSFGVSPYLLLPHAVLLHNETVLPLSAEAAGREEGQVQRALGRATDRLRHARELEQERRGLRERLRGLVERLLVRMKRLRELEEEKRGLGRALHYDFLPNVFHYPNERGLYDLGHESRGLRDREHELRMMLTEAEARYQIAVENRRRLADDARNGLLLVLSYAGFRTAFPGMPDGAVITFLVIVSLVYLVARR